MQAPSPNRAVLVGLGTGLITTGASTYYNRALAKGGDPGTVRPPAPPFVLPPAAAGCAALLAL